MKHNNKILFNLLLASSLITLTTLNGSECDSSDSESSTDIDYDWSKSTNGLSATQRIENDIVDIFHHDQHIASIKGQFMHFTKSNNIVIAKEPVQDPEEGLIQPIRFYSLTSGVFVGPENDPDVLEGAILNQGSTFNYISLPQIQKTKILQKFISNDQHYQAVQHSSPTTSETFFYNNQTGESMGKQNGKFLRFSITRATEFIDGNPEFIHVPDQFFVYLKNADETVNCYGLE